MNTKSFLLTGALITSTGSGNLNAEQTCVPEHKNDLCTKILEVKDRDGIPYNEALEKILQNPEALKGYGYCPVDIPS